MKQEKMQKTKDFFLDNIPEKLLNALNDYDARLMKTKDNGQKYPKFSFNIQLGTDTESKLICGVNAVQNPRIIIKFLH